MPKHSPMQPVAGDIVLHCAHSRDTDDPRRTFKIGTHWFKVRSPFTAPDGEQGVASWLNACDACWQTTGGDLQKLATIAVAGHIVWDGDQPVIVEEFS